MVGAAKVLKRGRIKIAIALIAGLALGGNVVAAPSLIWPSAIDGEAQNYTQRDNGDKSAEHRQESGKSHFWVGPFYGWVYSEDTLPQWIMAAFTVIATLASIAAVVMVGRSLRFTREATEAATNANEQALRLFEIENRPRLKIIGVRRDGFTDEDGRETDFLCIKVKNVGGGIAKGIAIDAEHIVPKLVLMGNRAVIDFANRADARGEDHILFVGDCDEFTPSNPYIDETAGYAVINIAYRGEMDPGAVYKTACAIRLTTDGGSIERGSMYAT